MITRVLQCTLKPGKEDDLKRLLHDVVLPELVKQPGVIDTTQLIEATGTNRLISVTFFESKELADRYARDVYPRFRPHLEALLENINVSTYNVETSTMHRIAAGKAA